LREPFFWQNLVAGFYFFNPCIVLRFQPFRSFEVSWVFLKYALPENLKINERLKKKKPPGHGKLSACDGFNGYLVEKLFAFAINNDNMTE
jgi:hypothetical protein